MQFEQYSVVRILGFRTPKASERDPSYEREPRVGDVATIVEVYSNPPGYELECSDSSTGITQWLIAFSPDEIELEVLG